LRGLKKLIEELSVGGTILGIFEDDYSVHSEKVILVSKDVLVLFTVGLT